MIFPYDISLNINFLLKYIISAFFFAKVIMDTFNIFSEKEISLNFSTMGLWVRI